MQKPIQRGNSWRMTVRFNGQRYTVTRDTEEECIKWAQLKLIGLKNQDDKIDHIIHITYKELFQKYFEEVGSKMRGSVYIAQQLKAFDKYWGRLAKESIHNISPQLVTAWRNERLKKVSPGTVQRQMCLYSSVFTFARAELFLIKENPFSGVHKPLKPAPRSRLISEDEIELILKGLEYSVGQTPSKASHYVAWCFLFAIETAMRKGEILGITFDHIHSDYIHLPMTKNGTSRDVPLSNSALDLLKVINRDSGFLIPQTSNGFRLIWQRNLHRVGLNGLVKFHDTRHVAITRFVNQQKLPVEILAKVTGHKSINVLVNTYYNPKASDIAKMLNAA